jgi:hypothetical protein
LVSRATRPTTGPATPSAMASSRGMPPTSRVKRLELIAERREVGGGVL